MSRRKKGHGNGAGGYGKPPVEHRFKKGQSGNPKGRPKGSRNLETILRKELERTVTVTDNGVRRTYRKSDLMVRVLTDKALKGNLPAFQCIQKMASALDQGICDTGAAGTIDSTDASELSDETYHEMLNGLLQRMKDKML